MADVDLEAEQVVGEEEEAPPKKRGLPVRKNVVVFGAILVLEAVLLLFIFNLLTGNTSEADAAAQDDKPADALVDFDQLKDVRQIDLGGISIYDETDTQRGAARRYTVQCAVWIKAETFLEIEKVNESNPDALEFVKDELRGAVKEWMLRNGGMTLRSLDMQFKAGEKIKEFIHDNLAPLRGKVVNVTFEEFRPSKW